MNWLIPLFLVPALILVLVYNYYLYRVEFVHKFILLHSKWWRRYRVEESEKKILETGNPDLIKDYYKLKKAANWAKYLRMVWIVIIVAFFLFSLLINSL